MQRILNPNTAYPALLGQTSHPWISFSEYFTRQVPLLEFEQFPYGHDEQVSRIDISQGQLEIPDPEDTNRAFVRPSQTTVPLRCRYVDRPFVIGDSFRSETGRTTYRYRFQVQFEVLPLHEARIFGGIRYLGSSGSVDPAFLYVVSVPSVWRDFAYEGFLFGTITNKITTRLITTSKWGDPEFQKEFLEAHGGSLPNTL